MPRTTRNPSPERLFEIASVQAGYFTAAQARSAGYTRQNLAYHVAAGRFERVARGLYRLRQYPSFPYEDVAAAWLKAGPHRAVVSHETALVLHDLSAVRPDKIDLTVERPHRPAGNRPRLPGVRIHTTVQPLDAQDVVRIAGVRVTSAVRTILDAADAGTDLDQIVAAVREGIKRGLFTPSEMEEAARTRRARVRRLISVALQEAGYGSAVH
ncbi:type IV toxin-antitoxin system AbiEi family antitoxin domain-containing protein [Carboxydochorda subterranea]|uniref:Type IV toxin-antitoxin system AbiEi family antitoxin domain-containing protein n=1 Tax=Carboxydichorda subterranea TaxID=3109565 RepID=A0ABZ1BTE2_9FIRM|nr:type IV toxin-antitoxin system AbiEi family antitoxin domain-containing protein [Limnochorda sp. L945t]WRP16061.1 type IV toxin-antitoxin system AbiEi family antitoxin domain-containing protein [Limnochorda sp. L945t]